MNQVKLYDLNMNELFLRGVTWLEFTPETSTVDRDSESVRDGDVTLGKKRKSRMIFTRFFYQSDNFLDYKMLRDELAAIFDPLKEMYAIDQDMKGKRWKVEVEGYEPSRINGTTAEVAVIFYSPKAYAHAVGTTLEDFPEKDYLWQYYPGDLNNSRPWKYIHTSQTFSIFNGGTEVIDPCKHELVIRLRSTGGTSQEITLTNTTNGDIFKYTGSFNNGDVLKMEGVRVDRNGLNVIGSTNLELISLNVGNNNFALNGISGSFEISFDFRHLYI